MGFSDIKTKVNIGLITATLALFAGYGHATPRTPLECNVAIVGAGPAGLHTAYKLTNPPPGSPNHGTICVFEKESKVGGLLKDEPFGPNPQDVVGVGAYRMYDNQYTYVLAKELGVPETDLVKQPSYTTLVGLDDSISRDGGRFYFPNGPRFGYGGNGDQFKSFYGVTQNTDGQEATFLCGAQVPRDKNGNPLYTNVSGISNQSTLDYGTQYLGQKGMDFYFDVNRFRADFAYIGNDRLNTDNVDAAAYFEYLATEYGGGGTRYIIPGFSRMVKAMEEKITPSRGGHIYTSQPVTTIESLNTFPAKTYKLLTPDYEVTANHVVIAINLKALKDAQLTGDIVNSIRNATVGNGANNKPVDNIVGVRAFTMTHKWNEAWWKDDIRYPDTTKLALGAKGQLANNVLAKNPILRANSTIRVTHEGKQYCLGSIELPYTKHHDDLMVTRTTYLDDSECIQNWLELWNNGSGEAAVNNQAKELLKKIFPAIFDNPNRPAPSITKTYLNEHPEGWYYLKAGALANGFTNRSIYDWSIQPLSGENVYLTGQQWHNQASAWSNAAFVSSARVLDEKFGFNLNVSDPPKLYCGKPPEMLRFNLQRQKK